MNVFKLHDPKYKFVELTENNYIRATQRKEPYYQEQGSDIKHYAICPDCGNPVTIVNLHVDKYHDNKDEDKRTMPMHARHIRRSVEGIADYNDAAYEDCSYANPVSSTDKRKREEGSVSHEILELLKRYPDVVIHVIQRSVGITIGDEQFTNMLRIFKSEDGHRFRYVNKFNLPYAFIYMANNQNLRDYSIDKRTAVGKQVSDAIEANAKWSFVTRWGDIRRQKGIKEFIEVSFYCSDFKIRDSEEGKKQAFDLHIVETSSAKGKNKIASIEISFDESYFYNIVNRRQRLTEIVGDIYE